MALYSRSQAKIEKDVEKKKAYNEYFKEMRNKNEQPMTYYHWSKTRRTGYYGAKGSVESTSRLSRKMRKMAGLPD